jgi:hypothetical protein
MASRASSTQAILITANPKGNFLEGPIGDTSKPGTIMQIKPGVALQGNEPTWIASASGTDGAKVIPALLLEDRLQGKLITDAYVSGTRAFIYCLLPGDIFLARFGETPGTGTAIEIGDRLFVDADDGVLIPEVGTSTAEDCFAVSLEAISYSADSSLVMCMKI